MRIKTLIYQNIKLFSSIIPENKYYNTWENQLN